MSWSDGLRALRGAAAGLGLSAGLAGCFTPLYGGAHAQLGAELQAVAVDPVPNRLGHYLRDELISDLNGTGSSPAAKYRLTITDKERVQSALIDIVTRRASNATVVVDLDYVLAPVGGGEPIATGTVTGAASYNRSEQRFANIRAARDAERRDAKTMADEITQRVAAALAARS